MSVRRGIEEAFAAWGRLVVRWRWPVIALCLGLTAALSLEAPFLRLDNSNEAFLHADDPVRLAYDDFRRRFGQDDRAVIAVRPEQVFELATLEKLRALHRELEAEVPYLFEITSLINARNTRGEGDELIVEDLLEDWPETPAEVEALRERVMANPLYVNNIVSPDGRFTTIALLPQLYSSAQETGDSLAGFEEEGAAAEPPRLSEAESLAFTAALKEIVARHDAPDFRLWATGGELPHHHLNQMLSRDVETFVSLAALAMLAWLALLFRRLSGALLPFAIFACTLVGTVAFMVRADIPMSVTMQIVPTLLLAVGVCDAIHILTIVYQRLEEGDTRQEAIPYALQHSGLAVLMTSVTTAGGLASFVGASVKPISDVGIVAPVGVMLAFFFTATLLPALLAVAPLERRSTAGRGFRRALSLGLTRVGDLAVGHPRAVLLGWGALVAVAALGFAQVRFSHDAIRWFPQGDPIRVAAELVDTELEGSSTLEVVLDSGHENGLHDPALLERIDRALRWAEAMPPEARFGEAADIRKTLSINDIVKETHRALNENRPAYYAIPGDRRLLAQELLLFENSGSDDLEDWTDSQFRYARLTLRLPWVDAVVYPPFQERVREGLAGILGDGVSFAITGQTALFGQTFSALVASMTRSYVIALVVITPIMVLLIGNWKRGLLSMVPNLLPIFLTLALMGALEIPLDASTLLIGCVIIGLAVDDTIHFMHKFNRYYEETGDPERAVHLTLETTGSALLFTSLVLGSGFIVITAGYMVNSFWFGLLATFATGVAFLADVVLAPALMVLVSPKRPIPAGA